MQLPWETILRFLKTLKVEQPYDPAIPFWGYTQRKSKQYIEATSTLTRSSAVLFTVAKMWKRLSVDEWIRKCAYKYSEILFSCENEIVLYFFFELESPVLHNADLMKA